MEQAETEQLVGELETRIDRLRSLYDMYFMGIERLEPLVVKKDVERRMAQLRKEQIRNTGLRFKFQTIVQRFNTYQTYWLRIARQIEQGTYRRDVMRAQARFGVDPTREQASSSSMEAALPAGASNGRDEGQTDRPEAAAPVYDLEEFSEEVTFEDDDDPFAGLGAPPSAVPAAAAGLAAAAPRDKFPSRVELDDLADPFEEVDPFPKPKPIAPRIALRPGASLPPRVSARPPDGASARPDGGAAEGVRPGSVSMPVARPADGPRVIVAKRASIPDEGERAGLTRPPGAGPVPSVAPRPAAAPAGAPRLMPAAPSIPAVAMRNAGPPPPVAGPGAGAPARASSPDLAPAAAASRASSPSIHHAPPRASSPDLGSAAAPPPQPPRAAPAGPRPGVSLRAAAPPAAMPAVSSPPQVSAAPPAPPPRAAPPPAPRAPDPPPPAASRIGDLSGDRFGEIFTQYVSTRQKHNEPTHAITRDALAKQLTESTARLKQKHGPKAIDFEVVVKDGKTILRPVVK